jgi:hypothetical protein
MFYLFMLLQVIWDVLLAVLLYRIIKKITG